MLYWALLNKVCSILSFVLDFTTTPSPPPCLSPLHAPPVALSTASLLLLQLCQYETGGTWMRKEKGREGKEGKNIGRDENEEKKNRGRKENRKWGKMR